MARAPSANSVTVILPGGAAIDGSHNPNSAVFRQPTYWARTGGSAFWKTKASFCCMKPKFFDGCAAGLLGCALAFWCLFALETAVILTASSILIILLGVAAYLLVGPILGRIMSRNEERNRGREAHPTRGGSGFWLGVAISSGVALLITFFLVTPTWQALG